MGLCVYEGVTTMPESCIHSNPENASVAMYTLPTCPKNIRHVGQAALYHGTTFKSLMNFLINGGQFLASIAGGGESKITESCVTEDAIFCSRDFNYAKQYATPCRFHNKKATEVSKDPLIQDLTRWNTYLARDDEARKMPYVRFAIHCAVALVKEQESLDAHNRKRSIDSNGLCSEEAFLPENLSPCFVSITIGANMQRDGSHSEFRLRDDTCVVKTGPPWNRENRINPMHAVQDMLSKVHQIRDEWPPKGSEVWAENLCAPGEEHHGTSLESFVIAGEKSGKFKRMTPRGKTIFDEPPPEDSVCDAKPSSTARPMPRISTPSMDIDDPVSYAV